MNKKGNPVCLHYLSSYLPLTENWIYKILINYRKYLPVIITRSIQNLDLFHIKPIYNLGSLRQFRKTLQLLYFKAFDYIPFFYRTGKNENVDILHVHFGNHGVKSIGLKRKLNVPMVCSFYGADAFKYPAIKNNHSKLKRLFNEADKILVLGPYMRGELRKLGCPENKLLIQHLGIENEKIRFEKRRYNPDEPMKFLMASSFVEKKGIDIALKAFAKIKSEYSFTIEIIGDGPLKGNISELIDNLDLVDRIKLHGYQTYDYFIQLAYKNDVFVQASKTTDKNDMEGTPMSLVDAMATGMPVVSTRHSDIPEIVIDGVNGFLSTENSIDDFARNLRKVFRSSDLGELSKNAREHVEKNFNIKTQVGKLEVLYSELINRNKDEVV